MPTVKDDRVGFLLHPVDLAVNKVLALAGRDEPRDVIDVLHQHRHVLALGALCWAACGKDPGFSPTAILELAARSSRYSEAELRGLDFDGDAPDAAELAQRWLATLGTAREIIRLLPAEEAGRAVLARNGSPYRGQPAALQEALAGNEIVFHEGCIRGAFPRIVG